MAVFAAFFREGVASRYLYAHAHIVHRSDGGDIGQRHGSIQVCNNSCLVHGEPSLKWVPRFLHHHESEWQSLRPSSVKAWPVDIFMHMRILYIGATAATSDSAIAATSERRRSDIGATWQRRRGDIGATWERHRSDIGAVSAPSQRHHSDIGATSCREECPSWPP